jgi:DNA transformation protein
VDREALEALFEPFGPVSVKRMFGGAGIYADGLCFALELGGEVFVKVDAETEAVFRDAGSSPFVYHAKGKPMTMAYWRLAAAAYDDSDELRRYAALGLDAARRAAAAKAKPKPSRKPPAKRKA